MQRILTLLALILAAFPLALPAQLPATGPLSSPYSFTMNPEPDLLAGGAGQVEPAAFGDRNFSRLTVRSTGSTLGTGAELATNLPHHFDLRVFGNYTNFTYNFEQSQFNIGVNLEMTNTGAQVDYYPWKSFRISPGYLMYNSDRVRADLQAQDGATFTINHVTYNSDDADPIHGIGRLVLAGRGFMVTTGWGHIVSRSRHHFTFPFEAGAAFISTPKVLFELQGDICAAQGYECREVDDYPGFTANLNTQLASWNKTVAPFHVYPLVEGGVAYTFRIRR
jgi:hypothetical protein